MANLFACSYDSGLNRGFTHYEDYILEGLVPLRTAWLVESWRGSTSDVGMVVGRVLEGRPLPFRTQSWLVPSFEPFRRRMLERSIVHSLAGCRIDASPRARSSPS